MEVIKTIETYLGKADYSKDVLPELPMYPPIVLIQALMAFVKKVDDYMIWSKIPLDFKKMPFLQNVSLYRAKITRQQFYDMLNHCPLKEANINLSDPYIGTIEIKSERDLSETDFHFTEGLKFSSDVIKYFSCDRNDPDLTCLQARAFNSRTLPSNTKIVEEFTFDGTTDVISNWVNCKSLVLAGQSPRHGTKITDMPELVELIIYDPYAKAVIDFNTLPNLEKLIIYNGTANYQDRGDVILVCDYSNWILNNDANEIEQLIMDVPGVELNLKIKEPFIKMYKAQKDSLRTKGPDSPEDCFINGINDKPALQPGNFGTEKHYLAYALGCFYRYM